MAAHGPIQFWDQRENINFDRLETLIAVEQLIAGTGSLNLTIQSPVEWINQLSNIPPAGLASANQESQPTIRPEANQASSQPNSVSLNLTM